MAIMPINASGLKADLLFTIRSMRKSPGFALTALLTLVLGIGATTAIFSVVYAVLLRPLPYQNPESLLHIVADDPGDNRSGVPYTLFEALQGESRTMSQTAVYYRNTGWSRVIVGGRIDPETVQAGFNSAGLFPLLGLSPVLGRVFDEAEVKSAEPVAVISHMLWQRRFGGTPDVLGRPLDVDSKSFTIIGVMPAEFRFPARETQLWLPITTNRYWMERPSPDNIHSRGFFLRWNLVARLNPASSIDEAQKELRRLSSRLGEQDQSWNLGPPIKAQLMGVEVGERPKQALILLLGAVLMVLLVACTNVANLLLARGVARSKELAIRVALGASHARIVQQVFTESLVLMFIATGAALLLSRWTLHTLVRWGPADLPRLEETNLNPVVLAFTLGVSLLTALLFGLGPALRAANNDPQNALRSPGRATGGSNTSKVLIVAEFALATVLLISAGLFLRSLWETWRVDLGFQPSRVLTLRLQPAAALSQAQRAAFLDEAAERIKRIPGVQNMGGIRSLFELGAAPTNSFRAVEGEAAEGNVARPLTWSTVSGDFFETIGIRLLAGRMFSEHDNENSDLVAIVDRSLAKRYWPNANPIGKRFKGQDRRGRNDDWITVIGVVADSRRQGVEQEPTPHVYLWQGQSELVTDWVIRTAAPPESSAASVRAAVRDIDPRTVVTNLMPMESQIANQTSARTFQTSILTLFAALALVLAAIGIFGIMSHAVERRTQEIGIRMALGADRLGVVRMILAQGVGLAGIGLAAGLGIGMAATALLSGLLFGVTPTDPSTMVCASLLLLAVAATATLIPAWRAASVDPLAALRGD
ncbi:MAG: ABC transporter permease [Acidobacteria bacterium]|nr:ABC transporter permease [Acidobacteriota bacterium]